jgi:hypothetical protein
MEMDEVVWNHAVYSKNRERLLNEEIAEGFFQRVLERAKPYMSDEHFTVDGTLIEAWASHRKFGLGIFTAAITEGELVAERIVKAVERGVKAATPFFNHLASEAVDGSRLNVRNNSGWLFDRYQYLRDQFREKAAEAEARKDEVVKTKETLPDGTKIETGSMPAFGLRREAA